MASEDESSDSSDDYLVPADQLNLDNSTFFSSTTLKKSHKSSSESSSDDDYICDESENFDSAALLAEVMRNLESTTNLTSLNSSEGPSTSSKTAGSPAKVGKNEITDLLLKGESNLDSNFVPSDNETEEIKSEVAPSSSIPAEGIQITIPGTGMIFNRRQKHKGIDLEAELIKKMNRRLRSCQLFIHKVGLLGWLAHGFHLNCQANNPEVLAIAMSLVPQKSYPKGRIDLKYLESFTKWFKNLIKLEFNRENIAITKELITKRLSDKKVHNYRELVLLYVCVLRSMGLNCRLVISLYPPAMKPSADQCFMSRKQKEKLQDNQKDRNKEKKPLNVTKKGKKSTKTTNKSSTGKIVPENSSTAEKKAKYDAKKLAVEKLRARFAKENTTKKLAKNDSNQEQEFNSPLRTLRSRKIEKNVEIVDKRKKNKTENVEEPPRKLRKTELKQDISKASTSKKNMDSDDDSFDDMDESSEDSDFEKIVKRKKVEIKQTGGRKTRGKSIDREVLSSDDNEDDEKLKKRGKKSGQIEEIEKFELRDGYYLWAEVFVESEESWIAVSIPDDKIHCVEEIYKKAPKPVLYVIAWNSQGTIKDVTKRYCPHWLTVTRKKRVEEKWWESSLAPWKEKNTALSKAEDEMLVQKDLEQPLPKTMGRCKGHPLYALARHLLKFEALYPPDCVPLGHLNNGDAIYSRHCVHTLRSRETWVKEARVVKPAQVPYKIVKAKPKYDKLSGTVQRDLPLELFGKWQTTPYDPPQAKNGIVPRNEYGNVDLFKQCMLPKGTVHIDLPGLARVAKKLKIDCVPAIVGFQFGGRGAMPMNQGFVVCEEFEDIVREAWEKEQIEIEKRAKEKRYKRIWGNWRKLIRGLLIREKVKAKYLSVDDDDDFNEDDEEIDKETAKSSKRTKQPAKSAKKKKT